MSPRILPRDERFYDIFVEDGENLLASARCLQAMVASYDRLEERVAEIRVLEHHGDELDMEINRRLEKAFVTPFDREDIHELCMRLDDVVDGIQEIAETFVIYGIDSVKDEGRQLADILAAQSVQLVEALRRLDGFRGIGAHLHEIHDLENQADGLSRAAIARLFRDGEDALTVIKWRDVYMKLEDTIDAAEDAAEVIERILAKS